MAILGSSKAGFRIRSIDRGKAPPKLPSHPPSPTPPHPHRFGTGSFRPCSSAASTGTGIWVAVPEATPLTAPPRTSDVPSPPQTPQLVLARPRHSGFFLPLFLPPLILQALGIISSRGLAFTKAGKNLFSWPVSPKPGSVKLGYQLEMGVGGEEGNQAQIRILTADPAVMSCHYPQVPTSGAHGFCSGLFQSLGLCLFGQELQR